MVKRFFKTSGKFGLTVAQALLPAASTIVSTPGACRSACVGRSANAAANSACATKET
jgi:hypothetical protein